MNIIVAGIHTGIGKTICSAVLVEALQYEYWKPVQAGTDETTDSQWVHSIVPQAIIHPENYCLKMPASPHIAAELEQKEITLDGLKCPASEQGIIIETAGGLMSPLSYSLYNIDLIKHLQAPVVLVSNDYLGSINHTMLSLELLKQYHIPVLGLVFNGTETKSSREFIRKHTELQELFAVPFFQLLDSDSVRNFAQSIAPVIKQYIK